MSRKEVNNEQEKWEREKRHKDAIIRSTLLCCPWILDSHVGVCKQHVRAC
jgi:hypothetical protein